jgi:hypothetical protein
MTADDDPLDFDLATALTAGDDPGLARADLELFGLLPERLVAIAPSPALRERVLAAVAREARRSDPPARPGGRWLLPLAASVAFAALAGSLWLGTRLTRQERALADLRAELDAARGEIAALTRSRGDLMVTSGTLAAQLSRVTAPGVVVCPLRPSGDRPSQPGAQALAFLVPEEGTWYLHARGLAPPARGVYVFWFLGEAGPALGGVVRLDAGAELTHGRLPEVPRMDVGMAVTLEEDASPTRPSGPFILFGDEKIQLS